MKSGSSAELARRQQQLVAEIFNLGAPANPGLKIYQTNLLLTAARALDTAYPVLKEMIGGEATRMLARLLLRSEPPASGDWADWGEGAARVIAATSLADEHPYLADLASLEWKLHQSSRAAQGTLDSDSLTRLTDAPLEHVSIKLVPSVQIHFSTFPVEVLWRAHRFWTQPIDPERLRAALASDRGDGGLLISRRLGRPEIKPLNTDCYRWFEDVLQGCSVATLLERHPQFNFSQWLGEAIQQGWLERLT